MCTNDPALSREATTEAEVYAGAHAGANVLLLLPLLWLLSFGLLVVRARLHLGIWPHPGRGNIWQGTWEPSPLDPKFFELHYKVLVVSAVPAAFSLLAAILILLTSAFAPSLWRSPSFLGRLALVCGLILALASVGSDLFVWFMD